LQSVPQRWCAALVAGEDAAVLHFHEHEVSRMDTVAGIANKYIVEVLSPILVV
jgi:hypothetical protein